MNNKYLHSPNEAFKSSRQKRNKVGWQEDFQRINPRFKYYFRVKNRYKPHTIHISPLKTTIRGQYYTLYYHKRKLTEHTLGYFQLVFNFI